ncbi:2-hydroxyacid dehydrogenase [Methylomonas koyamae]|uniref:D-glycerate dehydrogenase n=1 Tax=Methylomonas koyamae TaxID=702114 RepID=A0A291IIG8_9GAMM|nr:D-glycerate dehydrogenase [Methylomonas koyamae]ATG89981.1 2-hydroxyacid dehydrogenase [Methylomonas koyamae]OAI25911.1 D-glycerate dehydrogenase [Methylomonas koyamae]
MSKPKVLISRRWPAAVETKLQQLFDTTLNSDDRPLSADEFRAALQNYDAVCPSVCDALPAEVLNVANKRCRILGNFGVGYNHIDIAAAREQGLVVTNTPGVLTESTADIAMTLLLMTARRGAEGDRLVRSGQWRGWCPTHMMSSDVTGATLGLIGFGRIAQAMARKAHHGFGMKILYVKPSPADPEIVADLQAVRCETVEELLPQCDFVSLHCPGGADTRHLIDERRLNLMKPSAHLINTARGDVVDSKALIRALREKRIAGAGLDVYEGEPHLDPGFLELENAALLPHLGSATIATRTAMGEKVLANLQAFFAGQAVPDRVV